MHVTLHITTRCNFRCGYCYSPPRAGLEMSKEVATKAIELASRMSPNNTGVIFFGGEPLLRKDFIFEVIDACSQRQRKSGCQFHYKVTTNGSLLDEVFIESATGARLSIAVSLDGVREAHNTHRVTDAGAPTFESLIPQITALLRRQPYASALMVVTPETVDQYARSFDYLIRLGFRYIIASLNYAGDWRRSHLRRLEREYRKIATRYESQTRAGHKFYFSPFEKKIASHVHGKEALCQQCYFGVRQLSVAPDGSIYPCVQFVKDGRDGDYCLGNVWDGIDRERQSALFSASRALKSTCQDCALLGRCENQCSCLNWQTTGAIDQVSPILCETERLLIPIVDELAAKLYRVRAPLFIQKHYNPIYPLLSFLEDHEPEPSVKRTPYARLRLV